MTIQDRSRVQHRVCVRLVQNLKWHGWPILPKAKGLLKYLTWKRKQKYAFNLQVKTTAARELTMAAAARARKK